MEQTNKLLADIFQKRKQQQEDQSKRTDEKRQKQDAFKQVFNGLLNVTIIPAMQELGEALSRLGYKMARDNQYPNYLGSPHSVFRFEKQPVGFMIAFVGHFDTNIVSINIVQLGQSFKLEGGNSAHDINGVTKELIDKIVKEFVEKNQKYI
jgi:hypothetical protein